MSKISVRDYIVLAFILLAVRSGIAADVILPSLDRLYDQCTWMATHNSYANPSEDYNAPGSNQPDSITAQLDYGVRIINLDIWLIRQKRTVLGEWRWESYMENNTTVRDPFLKDIKDPQVVVAHGLVYQASSAIHDSRKPWSTLKAVLNEIRLWVVKHPKQVITIVFEEPKIADKYEAKYIKPAIDQSGITNFIFRPDQANPAVTAPEDRAGGWVVDWYGYPTLQQLVDAKKTVVLFPTYALWEATAGFRTEKWKLEVATVYGEACLPPNDEGRHWVSPRSESSRLDDFTRPLFSAIHIPNLPTFNGYAGPGRINDIRLLRRKLEDIKDLYNRLPTAVWLDYYERGFNASLNPQDPPGPAMFVNEINALWQAQAEITAEAQITPPASASGWHNTSNVLVELFGAGDTIQTIISRTFGKTKNKTSTNATYVLRTEGVTVVSFHAVGNLGKRSTNVMVEVGIDRTPPVITGALDRPPDRAGWYTSNVTAHFTCSDALSGISFCMPDVILSADGANQSVSGLAIDNADNQSTTTITNINIDTSGPRIRACATPDRIWPPNGRFVPVLITGQITDRGSGVDPDAASFSVEDEYGRVQPAGRLVVHQQGRFCLLLKLEARRSGGDKDGRKYLVRLNGADRAGHSSQTTLTIRVPHAGGKHR